MHPVSQFNRTARHFINNNQMDWPLRLDELVRRRYWKRLDQAIRQYYPDLVQYVTMELSEEENTRIARVLEACVLHTRDEDLRMSVGLDFGNFVLRVLTPGPFVPQFRPTAAESICWVCMESFADTEDERGVMVHRTCARTVAHARCFRTWSEVGGTTQGVCDCAEDNE